MGLATSSPCMGWKYGNTCTPLGTSLSPRRLRSYRILHAGSERWNVIARTKVCPRLRAGGWLISIRRSSPTTIHRSSKVPPLSAQARECDAVPGINSARSLIGLVSSRLGKKTQSAHLLRCAQPACITYISRLSLTLIEAGPPREVGSKHQGSDSKEVGASYLFDPAHRRCDQWPWHGNLAARIFSNRLNPPGGYLPYLVLHDAGHGASRPHPMQ